jgi:hypothetical protein
MICLIYASAATGECRDAQLLEILKTSCENNERLGLTGMLLHSEGNFLQVLEGEPEVIDALYKTICRDSRHAHLTEIVREPISKRSFGGWTMGFSEVSLDELASIDGSNDFFQDGSCFTQLDSSRAKKILDAFAKGRWRARLPGATARMA